MGESIKGLLDLDDDHKVVIRNPLHGYRTDENEDDPYLPTLDINIAIASATTAGGRIHMSQFKNNPNLKSIIRIQIML